ncbi:MAG: hypothetical protein M3N91_07360 [Pseudomonadota bacterium]|nr:hypothetical protein [Pseudomonadota bacterium]
METLLILLLLACLLVLVQNDQGMLVQLLSLVGINRRLTRSESTFVLILGGLVVLALFVAVEPEGRILLMFLDSVGVDLFVTVCVLYLRHNLVLVAAILLIPILKWTYRWGPVPGFWPSRLVIRSSASWAGYAVVVPVMTLCWATLAVLCIMAVLSGVVSLLGLT